MVGLAKIKPGDEAWRKAIETLEREAPATGAYGLTPKAWLQRSGVRFSPAELAGFGLVDRYEVRSATTGQKRPVFRAKANRSEP